jgi:small conductance mechanosensitive channel
VCFANLQIRYKMLGFILLQNTKTIDASVIDSLLKTLFSRLLDMGGKIILAVIAYFIGVWVISLIRKLVRRILTKRNVEGAVATFVNSLTNMLLKISLALVIIGILGIPTTSFAAILAAAGLAVGMAMKDNLSNFAGGVMILVNKPFRLNDRILVQGQDGMVQEIGILYTVLLTGDGRTIYLPNGPLSTGTIVNYSAQKNRRVDITLNVNYGVDADALKEIIAEVVDSNPNILKTPTPFIGVTAINNSNFDITIRAWGENNDYGKISVALKEDLYRVLSNKGIFTSSPLRVKMEE